VSISSPGAGDAAVWCLYLANNTASVTAAPSGWTPGPSLPSATSPMYCYYFLGLSSGASAPSATVSPTNSGRGSVYYEWSTSLGNGWTFDKSGTNTGTSTNPVGVGLTLTYTTDVIFQTLFAATVGSGTTGITGGTYSTDFLQMTGKIGSAGADQLNTSNGAAPTWTNANNSAWETVAVAIEEISGSSDNVSYRTGGVQPFEVQRDSAVLVLCRRRIDYLIGWLRARARRTAEKVNGAEVLRAIIEQETEHVLIREMVRA
jgi:hypothetical protein